MKPDTYTPFKLENVDEYLLWREKKLKNANTKDLKKVLRLKKTPPHFSGVFTKPNSMKSNSYQDAISYENIDQHSSNMIDEILKECSIDNYCLYTIEDHKKYNADDTKQLIRSLASSCGLFNLDTNICADKDSLTSIQQSSHKGQHEYIPYTNKKLSWHTDGYYNLPVNTINSMLLHCFKDADSGGGSAFMDHEIAYILLRDSNPKWIEALSQNNVMTIPANILKGKVIRPEQTGPVFSLTTEGRLHMRFTARKKNIIWKKSKNVLEAVEFLNALLNSGLSNNYESINGSEYIVKHKLKSGEGLISRNILHCREAFEDNGSASKQRLLFRGRYYDELPSR